ncbi:MAG: DsbA family protein [Candidatus Nanopelagicales bacterium]
MNTAKQRAAELAAANQAAERKAKLITIAGVTVVVLIVAGILTFAFLNRNTSSSTGPTAEPNASAIAPTGADGQTYGLVVGNAPASAPLLQIFEDAQCPACQSFEAAFGEAVQELIDSAEVRVMFQPMFFLDNRLPQSKGSSLRAANALGCAADEGVAAEFHRTIFANAPAVEGTGWTDIELKLFGAGAGVADPQRFDSCVDSGKYFEWVANSNKWAFDSGVEGTPTIWLDGKPLPDSAFASQEAFLTAVRGGN